MYKKATLTAIAAAAIMTFAAPQSATALPNVDGAKQLNSSNVRRPIIVATAAVGVAVTTAATMAMGIGIIVAVRASASTWASKPSQA